MAPGPFSPEAGQERLSIRSQNTKKMHPVMSLPVDQIVQGSLSVEECIGFIQANEGKAPLLYTSDTPAGVSQSQGLYGRDRVAERIEGFFARIAVGLVDHGIRRLVVAGGETSGAVVSALGLKAMSVGQEVAPGVPILLSEEPLLALALKSGNFGQPDFFSRALELMAGQA